jgi:fructose PTS system EIIBC or EIIC component
MTRIVAVTACPTGVAHTSMAAEALKQTAAAMGHQVVVETQGSDGVKDALSPSIITEADVVILAADIHVDTARFGNIPLYETKTSEAIRNTRTVVANALALVGSAPSSMQTPAAAAFNLPAAQPASAPGMAGKRLVAITSCPTGIAHTFMAAEGLQKAARALGHTIKVETQGSVGVKNQHTAEEIAAADAIIIAADTNVDTSRFTGRPIFVTSTKQAIHHGQDAINAALTQSRTQPVSPHQGGSYVDTVKRAKAERSQSRSGPYRHLMTGVSYMLPIVVAGGLCIALAFALGGIYAGKQEGTLAAALMQIGGGAAFSLFVAVLSGFIAYSIADRPGIAPGLIGGLLAQTLGAGFLGGIVSGFLAGYLTKLLAEKIKLPVNLEGLKPVLILPLLSTLVVGLLMIFVLAPPAKTILNLMTEWLLSMQGTNAVLLGLILGSMMAFDMGGPVNKAAYTFAVGLLTSGVTTPMAAVMAAGMTPPLGLALAGYLFKNRFAEEEREACSPALVLGISFITEGAIPFAAKDSLRVIPSLMIGSAVTAALSMFWRAQLRVPHGGIFAMFIPGALTHLLLYLVAIVVGKAVT